MDPPRLPLAGAWREPAEMDGVPMRRISSRMSAHVLSASFLRASVLPAYLLAAAALASAQGIDYLDPADAGPDYPLQGEYAGQALRSDGSKQTLAAQVIALG